MSLIGLSLLELLPNTTHRDTQADSTILVLLRVLVESPVVTLLLNNQVNKRDILFYVDLVSCVRPLLISHIYHIS
jgi:hypothetical protein